jgi:hypothetical protein
MFKQMINTSTVRTALVTAAIALLAAFVSAPATAKDKTLSKTELRNLISTAHTKADHERIAQYFDAKAANYEAEAKEHAELGGVYQMITSASESPGGAPLPQYFDHCDSLSKSLSKAAEDAHALAAGHRAQKTKN